MSKSREPNFSDREWLALQIYFRLIESPNYFQKTSGVARVSFDRADAFLEEVHNQRRPQVADEAA